MTSCDILLLLRRQAFHHHARLFSLYLLCLLLSMTFAQLPSDASAGESRARGGSTSTEVKGEPIGTNTELESIYDDITDEGFLIGQQDHIYRLDKSVQGSEAVVSRQRESLQRKTHHHHGEMRFGGHEVKLKERTEPELHPVPVAQFRRAVNLARTFHDIIRLFYTDNAASLGNGQLARLYVSQVYDPTRVSGGWSRGPPQHHDTKSGADTASETVNMEDMMMGDSPCPQCHVIPASSAFRAATEHRKRHKRKEVTLDSSEKAIAIEQGSKFTRRYLSRVRKKTKQAMEKARDHVQKMSSEWGCREPSPVITHINDLERDATRFYAPECTVIHKCQKTSGCCGDGQICGVKSSVNVTLHFWAPKLMDGNVTLTDDSVVTFTFENHTECECHQVPTIPHCAPCPRPFIQYYSDQTECKCGCLDDNRKCRKIKRGRAYFEKDVIDCLKDGRCAYPTCAYGNFSSVFAIKGRCPHKKEIEKARQSASHEPAAGSPGGGTLRQSETKSSVLGKKVEMGSREDTIGLGSGANEQLDVH